jgi:hypothetical protein
MRKKTFYFLILSLLITSGVCAQEELIPRCGTVEKTDAEMELLPWYDNNDYLKRLRDSTAIIFDPVVQERSGGACSDIDGMFLIPVRFWIYRETDNDSAMPDDRDLQIMMDRLNFLYQSNGMNVRFFMVCPQYETNSDMANATDWDAFWNTFNGNNTDPNSVNVHIVKTYNGGGGGVYNSLADLIVVTRSVYTSFAAVSTLAHEIGHYFGLEHTHRNATKGACRAEAVSRTRNFPWNCLPKTGKICEKNGDALCDTPADPELAWGDPAVSKVDNNCNYNWGESDNFGDAYVPDESNIMSYAPRECRTTFSPGQTYIMGESMIYGRQSIYYYVDYVETDPDKYEPDDSDFPGVPRPIALEESQCHSFYDMIECQDPADWLIMSLSQGVIGSYQIRIEKVGDDPNPVEKVKVWNIGANQMRSTEVATTSYTIGTTMVFKFPCSTPSSTSLLLEVVRKSDVTEGKYRITLTSSTPLSISGSNIICTSTSYTVEGAPSGATVNWSSSPSIILANTSGLTVTVQSFTGGGVEYWIEATVTWGNCTQKIRRTFGYEGSGGIPDFFIVPEIPACFPGEGSYSISNPIDGITYAWSCQGAPCGNIQSFGNGEHVTVEPDGTGSMTLIVTATDGCGNSLVKTKAVSVQGCHNRMENIIVTPNPTATGIVNVTIQDTYVTEGAYQVYITNQMSELKYQSNEFSKYFSVNLGELPNGMYYIHVYREDISGSASFIINR